MEMGFHYDAQTMWWMNHSEGFRCCTEYLNIINIHLFRKAYADVKSGFLVEIDSFFVPAYKSCFNLWNVFFFSQCNNQPHDKRTLQSLQTFLNADITLNTSSPHIDHIFCIKLILLSYSWTLKLLCSENSTVPFFPPGDKTINPATVQRLATMILLEEQEWDVDKTSFTLNVFKVSI